MEKTLTRLLLLGAVGILGVAIYYRQAIMNLIMQFEGFSATPYNDPPGSNKYSIGYGHQIQPGEHFTAITEAQGQALLEQDTATARAAVADAIQVPLNADQTAGLVSFVYNIGVSAFNKGSVPDKINAGDFQGAADTMRQYIHAGGSVSQALIDRRNAEAAPFDVA